MDFPSPVQDFEPDARRLDDVDSARSALFDNVYNSVARNFDGSWSPANSPYTLRAANLQWDTDKPFTLADQKRAIMERKTLGRRLKGTWELVDKATGDVVDRKNGTFLKVPYMTQRGTFIYNGREYGLSNQFRLRGGVYTRRTGDGELESHFNLLPRTGRSFRVRLKPDSGQFMIQAGQASIPLYPVLRAAGVRDEDMKMAWGDQLYNANKSDEVEHRAVNKAYDKLVGGKDEDKAEGLRNQLARMRLDPDVVRRNLGRYIQREDKAEDPGTLLLASTQKLISVNRGDDDVDDRDSLSSQTLVGPEDYFAEQIDHDAKTLAGRILWKSGMKGKLSGASSGLLDDTVSNTLLSSGLGSPLEEINPLEAHDVQSRVTRMGRGGLPSTDSIPSESRDVQATYLGYVDPFRSVECYSADMEVLGRRSWIKWPNVTPETELATLENGQIAYMKPESLTSYRYDGWLETYSDGVISYAVTPEHRMWVASTPVGPFRYDYARDAHGCPLYMLLADLRPIFLDRGGFGREEYSGTVYCATMPTGLLVVRRAPNGMGAGFICGNSEKVGVDNRMAQGVRKGRDGQLYRQFANVRTGRPEWVPMSGVADKVVAFPGEMESGEPLVRAVRRGKLGFVRPEEVDYTLQHSDDMLDSNVNLVPFANATQGNRLMLAGKMMLQAMSLRNREAPLVRSKSGAGGTYESIVGGRMGAVRAKGGGTVLSVTPDEIRVMGDDGQIESRELYNNFPFNRKSYFTSTPAVAPGDRVAPGQILASSNYTDGKGDIALGTHLRVAYLPYKGLSFEDAYVISESAAEKLGHEAMYSTEFDPEDGLHTGLNKFVSRFPAAYKKEQLSNLDGNGVAKPGAVVRKGDPLVLVVSDPKKAGEGMGGLKLKRDANRSLTWEHDYDGEVTDATVTEDGGVKVAVRAFVPMREGDKISGLHGDKGVVRIVPDAQMPVDGEGRSYDILQNPLTLPTRKNNAQVYAMLLSKVARKTGRPYELDKFHKGSIAEFVRDELAAHGFDPDGYEQMYDPETGREIKNVLAGEKYVMALHHTAESKAAARDTGAYTSEGIPAWGGHGGGKSMANMGLNALLSHGATRNIADMKQFKSSRNDEFWREYQLGRTPPAPRRSMVHGKFLASLKAAGVNLQKRGEYRHLTAMTDKDVDELTGDREVSSSETLDAATMQPIKGGLFDRAMFGGAGGSKWAKYVLPEPMLSPVMEDSAKLLLGLTNNEFREIVAGKMGKPGGELLREKLGSIKLDEAIALEKANVASASKSSRDKAVKRLRILSAAKESGIHPKDWVVTKVPVLPAEFRPVSVMPGGTSLVADPNSLYQDLMENAKTLKENARHLGTAGVAEERLNTYDALKAVTGLGDPVHPKLKEQGVSGLLRHVFGKNSPKFGMYQRRVLFMNLDKSAKGVITPDPDLDMDHIGIPEEQAWESYKSFVMRRMVRNGLRPDEAARRIEERTKDAKQYLMDEMEERPVLFTRAPALSRFGVQAAKPVLVAGKAIRMNPMVVCSQTGDHDGDAISFHVPVSKDAVDEAYQKMLPSRNLLHPSDFKPHYLPKYEFLLGLFNLTSGRNRKKRKEQGVQRFASMKDLLRAVRRGEIDPDDEVDIAETA